MVGLPYDTFVPVTWPKKYQRCEGILGAKMYAVRKCNSALFLTVGLCVWANESGKHC